MSKVLLVLSEPPTNFGGAAARWYHVLLTGLIARNAKIVVLCCSGGSDRDAAAKRRFGEHCDIHFFGPSAKSMFGRLTSFLRPYSYLYSKEMKKCVNSYCAQSFDIIRFESHFSGGVIRKAPAGAELSVHQLYCIDASLDRPIKLSQRILKWRVLSVERALLRRFYRISVLTDRLAQKVKEIHPTAEVRVIPMTLDPELYEFQPKKTESLERPTIGLIGSFDWGPSLSAGKTLVEEIWPRYRQVKPEARLLLVGRSAGNVFGHLHGHQGIEVFGDVDSTVPYFHMLDCLVYMPKVGSGMKVKVMEAIAYGVPVITNVDGAEGLPEGVVTIASDTAEVVRLLDSLIQMRTVGTNSLIERRQRLFSELSIQRCLDGMNTDPFANRRSGANES